MYLGICSNLGRVHVEEALPHGEELEARCPIPYDHVFQEQLLLLKHKVVVSFLVLITFWVFFYFLNSPLSHLPQPCC